MPGLLPIILAGSYIVLAADKMPELNIEPSCRAAATASVSIGVNRDENSCKRDENDARAKLDQEWGQFTPSQRAQCVRLSTLGGSPSYVELITCLELTKAAAELPGESKMEGRAKR
jgi:hypothetical protein